MKRIAIACEGEGGLDALVSAHFGRCACYTLVEAEGTEVLGQRVARMPSGTAHQPGVVPQFIRSLDADVVIAGGMGPRAVMLLERFGIEVVTGASGNAAEVVLAYLEGRLSGIVPCNHDHPESCGGHGHASGDHDVEPGAGPTRPVAVSGPVAVSAADGSGVDAAMDPRFGRAPYFVVADPHSGQVLQIVKSGAAAEAHGAGIAAAQQLSALSVSAVVAGRFGPKALSALSALGIRCWSAPDGLTVGQAVQQLGSNELTRAG